MPTLRELEGELRDFDRSSSEIRGKITAAGLDSENPAIQKLAVETALAMLKAERSVIELMIEARKPAPGNVARSRMKAAASLVTQDPGGCLIIQAGGGPARGAEGETDGS